MDISSKREPNGNFMRICRLVLVIYTAQIDFWDLFFAKITMGGVRKTMAKDDFPYCHCCSVICLLLVLCFWVCHPFKVLKSCSWCLYLPSIDTLCLLAIWFGDCPQAFHFVYFSNHDINGPNAGLILLGRRTTSIRTELRKQLQSKGVEAKAVSTSVVAGKLIILKANRKMCCIKEVCSTTAVIIDVTSMIVGGLSLCWYMCSANEDVAWTLFVVCFIIQAILLIIRCQRFKCVSEWFIFMLDLVVFPAIYIPQLIIIYIMYVRGISDSFILVEAFVVFAGLFWRIAMAISWWQETTVRRLIVVLMIPLITTVFTVLVVTFGSKDYFKNVGVFLHHPDYDILGGQDYWTHIIDVSEIPSKPHVSKSFIYRCEKTATHLNFALHRETVGEGSSKCYQVSLTTRNITDVYSTDCWTSMFTEPTSFHMTFTYLTLRHSLEMIYYNIKMWNGSSCTSYKDVTNSVKPVLSIYVMNDALLTFAGSHFLVDKGQPRFYGSQRGDLQDVAYLWDTWPTKPILHLDSNQHVICDD